MSKKGGRHKAYGASQGKKSQGGGSAPPPRGYLQKHIAHQMKRISHQTRGKK